MVTSFADGSKISFEQAVVANATGMRVQQRGMRGYVYEWYVDEPDHVHLFDVEQLQAAGGVVDYVLGAKPGAGVFVLGKNGGAKRATHLDLYKMGEGPLYCFCTPFHLCYFEVPFTIARAVLFGDAAVTPIDGPMVDVVATAKRDLQEAVNPSTGSGNRQSHGQCAERGRDGNGAAAADRRGGRLPAAPGRRTRRGARLRRRRAAACAPRRRAEDRAVAAVVRLIGEPLVTVVTPVFNGERYLEECIESVLAQTYQNWEYVIFDNRKHWTGQRRSRGPSHCATRASGMSSATISCRTSRTGTAR